MSVPWLTAHKISMYFIINTLQNLEKNVHKIIIQICKTCNETSANNLLISKSHKILFFALKVKLWNELYLVFCFLLPFLLDKMKKKKWKFLNVIRTVQSDSCMIKYDFQDLYSIFSYLILCTMEWKYVWGSICILLILAIS